MTEDELLAGIRAAPDDDRPRLVYADCLLDRGDWRGELIQVQCLIEAREWPRSRRRQDGPTLKELRARERELLARLDEIRPDWAARWPPKFKRGFATDVVVSDLATFLRAEATIRRAHPLASIELPDGSTITSRVQGGGFDAVMTCQRVSGASMAGGSSEETTTVRVFDGEGRVRYAENSTWERSYSDAYDHTQGETFTCVALSADGRSLTLKTSGGRALVRSLRVASEGAEEEPPSVVSAASEQERESARLADELHAASEKRPVLRAIVAHLNEQRGPLPEVLESALLGSFDAMRGDDGHDALRALAAELRGECREGTSVAAFFDGVVQAHDRLASAAYDGIIASVARSYPRDGAGRCPKCKSKKVSRSPVGIEFTQLDCGDCGFSDVVDVWGLADWGDET